MQKPRIARSDALLSSGTSPSSRKTRRYAAEELTAADGKTIPADGLIEVISLDESGHGKAISDLPMRNLKTIEKKVRAVLEKNEDARNDDMVLYLALCNACLKDAGAMPLAEIMTQHKYLGLPSFESVSRTRRKLQARYPELAGSRPVQKMRATGEKAYRRYAKE